MAVGDLDQTYHCIFTAFSGISNPGIYQPTFPYERIKRF